MGRNDVWLRMSNHLTERVANDVRYRAGKGFPRISYLVSWPCCLMKVDYRAALGMGGPFEVGFARTANQ